MNTLRPMVAVVPTVTQGSSSHLVCQGMGDVVEDEVDQPLGLW